MRCRPAILFGFVVGLLSGVCFTLSIVVGLLSHRDDLSLVPNVIPERGTARFADASSLSDLYGSPLQTGSLAFGGNAAQLQLPNGEVLYAPPEMILPWIMAQPTAAPAIQAPRQTLPMRAEPSAVVEQEVIAHTLMPPLPPLLENLETISIIFVCRNEHEYLQRTIESVMQSTPGGEMPGIGLHEIIVFDDASEPLMETGVTKWQSNWPARDKVLKFVRVPESVGLMNARQFGARHATGDVLVFLDCHINTTQGWWPPFKRHVNENYRRIVTPSIPNLDDNWNVQLGSITVGQVFDWGLNQMSWIDSANDWVMILCGGLFAISRRWWFESGEYDMGMQGWGTEQVEQSIRTWLCGGEIVVERSSIIGHKYRSGGKIPYRNPEGSVRMNKIRAVEVWFDEYKDYYYHVHPEDRAESTKPDFDIKARVDLRRRLQCKPFRWFMERFRPYFLLFGMIADDRPHSNCRWTASIPDSFLGALAWVWPNSTDLDCYFYFDKLGKVRAEELAKAKCVSLGAICAGITCDESMCNPRRGTPFMHVSKTESTQLKVCCQYKKVPGYYLPRIAYMSPIIPQNEAIFPLKMIDLALNRCEALSDLCAGVTCDSTMCMPREGGHGGLQPSPVGEVTFVKECK